MGHCHDGVSICLQCLISCNLCYSEPFKNIFIKTLVTCVTDMLKTIPVEDFQCCYQKWDQYLHRCVAARGNYFEGDNIDV